MLHQRLVLDQFATQILNPEESAMHTEQNLISAEDVAQKLGIHPQTVRRLTESGKLPAPVSANYTDMNGMPYGKPYRAALRDIRKEKNSHAARNSKKTALRRT